MEDRRTARHVISMYRGPISAVIYTKDNPDSVVNLVKHLDGFVEEIVIVDSSSPENYAQLKNQIGNVVRLYNIPPLGYADPFHKLGGKFNGQRFLSFNKWLLYFKYLFGLLTSRSRLGKLQLPRNRRYQSLSMHSV